MKIIIHVEDGLVQAVYADKEAEEIELDIVDLDVSDFAEEEEVEEVDNRRKEMERIVKNKEWKRIW